MEVHIKIPSLLFFVINLCHAMELGKVIRLVVIKKLYPKTTIKDIENYEKNTKTKYFIPRKDENET